MTFQGHRSNQCQAPEGKFLRKLLCRKSLLLLPLHTPQILDTLHLETQLQLSVFSVLSKYIYTHTISHHVSIKLISFLQFFTCCKIVLRKEKQNQTKTPLWVFLKKKTTQLSGTGKAEDDNQGRAFKNLRGWSNSYCFELDIGTRSWTANNPWEQLQWDVLHSDSIDNGISVILFLVNFVTGSSYKEFTMP